MLTDPIADILTRIRNASMVYKTEVLSPYSKEREALAKVLVKEGYLKKIKKQRAKSKDKKRKNLVLELKYSGKRPAIKKIIRISRPGLRVYSAYKKLPKVLSGFGIVIVSTSKGIMTGKEAKKKKLGGEIICKIW